MVFSGFLLEETKTHTTLRELSGASKFFRNSEINSKINTGVSLMPNGLLNGLDEGQLKNLFAYLRITTPPFWETNFSGFDEPIRFDKALA